jgi:hypothetical protein
MYVRVRASRAAEVQLAFSASHHITSTDRSACSAHFKEATSL